MPCSVTSGNTMLQVWEALRDGEGRTCLASNDDGEVFSPTGWACNDRSAISAPFRPCRAYTISVSGVSGDSTTIDYQLDVLVSHPR